MPEQSGGDDRPMGRVDAPAAPGSHVDPVTAAPGTTGTCEVDAKFPRVAMLMKRGISRGALRNALSIDPSLAQEIPSYLAAGGDSKLNDAMAAAFPATLSMDAAGAGLIDNASATHSSLTTIGGQGSNKSEKQPTDPTQPLPPARTGNKPLDKGVMKWTLKADDHETANIDVDFKPDASKVEAKNVSFVQTVISKVGIGMAYGGGTATNPTKRKGAYQPFEEPTSKNRVDHFPDGENDPFYGAEWDQAGNKWKRERASWRVGDSTKGGISVSAKMTDGPNAPESRMGLGGTSSEFETVSVVLNDRGPGCLVPPRRR